MFGTINNVIIIAYFSIHIPFEILFIIRVRCFVSNCAVEIFMASFLYNVLLMLNSKQETGVHKFIVTFTTTSEGELIQYRVGGRPEYATQVFRSLNSIHL